MTIDLPPKQPAIIQPSYNNIRSKTMKITAEIDDLLLDNPDGDGYIPQDGLTTDEMNKLKEVNNEYKKLYGIDLITF